MSRPNSPNDKDLDSSDSSAYVQVDSSSFSQRTDHRDIYCHSDVIPDSQSSLSSDLNSNSLLQSQPTCAQSPPKTLNNTQESPIGSSKDHDNPGTCHSNISTSVNDEDGESSIDIFLDIKESRSDICATHHFTCIHCGAEYMANVVDNMSNDTTNTVGYDLDEQNL